MTKLIAAAAIAVIAASIGNVVTMIFGLIMLERIEQRATAAVDNGSVRVQEEIRNFRADLNRAGWTR